MWFKIKNRTINFDTITSFLCDDDSFMITIEFIGGNKNRFSFETWGEYYDTKTYLNDLASNHEKMEEENRKALEEEQKIQQMFEALRYLHPIKEGDVNNNILNGCGLKPFKHGKPVPEDY